ncbi:hypothetical protein CAEBREN_05753 [Caenorhabditis brenneri]|uniref:T-box domain-containing protein n=1 Tax=Caenorhabditis brenneri TaxID=135651 RepID=G0MBD5_CAEBE|nr:hypothetical protein CAEBREN_05753 [Caenorhabditis brenneri]
MNNFELTDLRVSIQRKYDIIWQEAFKCFHDMFIPIHKKDLNPYLVYHIEGLDPEKLYKMTLHFEVSDASRWVDRGDHYYASGPADAPLMSNTVWHELGSRSGEFWMTQGCSFIFVKMTRRIEAVQPPNEICLRLYHKYIPVLSIYQWTDNESMRIPPATFRIAHTEFLAAQFPTTNPRLAMLTKKSKKHFAIKEKIRNAARDKPTVYATCQIQHYLKRAEEVPKQPLWCIMNRRRLETSNSDSNIHTKDLETGSDLAESATESPILQVKVGVTGESSPANSFTSPVLEVNVETGEKQIKQEDPNSPQTDSSHLSDNVAGKPPVNGFTNRVSEVNMGTGEKQIKQENPSSPQTDPCHLSNNGARKPLVTCFTVPGIPVNLESEVKQEQINSEDSGLSQIEFRHLPDNVVGEPPVNGFTSPVSQLRMNTEVKPKKIEVENSSSPKTDSRHLQRNAVDGPPVDGSSPVSQSSMDHGVQPKRIKLEDPSSNQTDSGHQPNSVVEKPTTNGFTSLASQSSTDSGVEPKQIKLENLSSPQTDSRHLQNNVVEKPTTNGFTSLASQSSTDSGVEPKQIKLENLSSPQTDSRHLQNNVVDESLVNGSTRPVSQLSMEYGVKPKRIKLEDPSSNQTDSGDQLDGVVGGPLVNDRDSPNSQLKKKTGEKQKIIPGNNFGSHHTDSLHLPMLPPVFSFEPAAFPPQHPPVQTPNFANLPFLGMQPNFNHLALWHQFNPLMMQNYQNPHSFNFQFPLLPQANNSVFPNPNPFMNTHPNLFFPTTPPYQTMPPPTHLPHSFNPRIPPPSLPNGSYLFPQPYPDNSAQGNIPNPRRSP